MYVIACCGHGRLWVCDTLPVWVCDTLLVWVCEFTESKLCDCMERLISGALLPSRDATRSYAIHSEIESENSLTFATKVRLHQSLIMTNERLLHLELVMNVVR